MEGVVILAFDTSTALTTVAVTDGADVVAEERHLDARRHAEVLAPMLQDVLSRSGVGAAEVEAIACGVGPGPYTGLRVGIATALAVGTAWNRPVFGICSLDAIAAAALNAGATHPLGVASDARRKEVYWATYGANGVRLAGPLVSSPIDIDPRVRSGSWAGHGVLAHTADFGPSIATDDDETSALLYPHACWIGRRANALLAAGESVDSTVIPLVAHGGDGAATSTALHGMGLLRAQPLYLRRPDAIEVADRPVPPR
jgi:tRNA threonylcarbamoyl adenosine modification protein YeaZ